MRVVLGMVCCILIPMYLLASNSSAEQSAKAKADAVRWRQAPHVAAEDAGRMQRPIVVYVTSKNCVHCRRMEHETWRDEQVVCSVSENWIPLKIDADTDQKLVEAFQVQTYPTTLLYTRDRRLISRLEGFFSPDLLRESLRKARTGRLK